jgi:DNA topoisomerase-1
MSFQPTWYRNPQNRWYRLYNDKKTAAQPPLEKWKKMGLFFPDGYPELWVDIKHTKTPVRARDSEGRTQYQYWSKTKEQHRRHHWGRFHEMSSTFWNRLRPLLRRPFPRGNEQWNDSDIYRLMLNFSLGCGVRPGYPKYRDQNQSFGVCTLEWKHLHVNPDWDSPQNIEIEFPGKKQVLNTCECNRNSGGWERDFISYLRWRRGLGYLRRSDPVWLVSDGSEVHPDDLLDYLREHVHPKLTVKDLRTWLVHRHAWNALQKVGNASVLTEKERKQEWRRVIKEIAEQTHHTPAVCQSSYLCPSMKEAWMEGKVPFRGGRASEERWFKTWWARDSRR